MEFNSENVYELMKAYRKLNKTETAIIEFLFECDEHRVSLNSYAEFTEKIGNKTGDKPTKIINTLTSLEKSGIVYSYTSFDSCYIVIFLQNEWMDKLLENRVDWLLIKNDLVLTGAEARRLIDAGAVKINGRTVDRTVLVTFPAEVEIGKHKRFTIESL